MSVRIQFPRGSAFSFLRQFTVDGNPLDLTGATLACTYKQSPDDADEDALGSPTIALVNAALGTVRITFPASLTEDQLRHVEGFWRASATLSGGGTYVTDSTQGPVRLEPYIDLAGTGMDVAETLTLADTGDAGDAAATNSFLGFRADITSAALHRAVATAGVTTPWVIATLEDGLWCTWTLRARDGESDDGTTYRLPTDYDADDNAVIWVKTALS